jgi:hypothetical protein
MSVIEDLKKKINTDVSGKWIQVGELEKFAELIVRECANIDFRREVGLTADDDYEIGKVIKVHFGVKE